MKFQPISKGIQQLQKIQKISLHLKTWNNISFVFYCFLVGLIFGNFSYKGTQKYYELGGGQGCYFAKTFQTYIIIEGRGQPKSLHVHTRGKKVRKPVLRYECTLWKTPRCIIKLTHQFLMLPFSTPVEKGCIGKKWVNPFFSNVSSQYSTKLLENLKIFCKN